VSDGVTGWAAEAGAPSAPGGLPLPLPVADDEVDRMLADLRTRLQADGVVLAAGGRRGQSPRVVCTGSVPPAPDDGALTWLAGQSRAAVVGDLAIAAAPVRSPWLEAVQARSLVAIPLRADGAVAGAMLLFARTPDRFAPACVAAAEAAAAVVGPALGWLWRAQAAERVLDIAKIVVRRGNIKDLLRDACQRAVRLCDGGRAALWVFDHQGRYAASFSVNASGTPDHAMWQRFREAWPAGRRAADDPVTRWLIEHREPLVLDDYADSPFADAVISAVFGPRSLIALPLVYEDRVVAVMTIDRGELRPFSLTEVRLAVSVTETIAPLVERARRLDETEAELRRAEAQVEIARALGSTLELRPLLRTIAEQAARACGMDRCSVFLRRDGRLVPMMSQYADRRVDTRQWEMFKAWAALGLERVPVVEEAVESREPVIVDDTQTDPRIPDAVRGFLGRRLVALPLMRADELVGGLVLETIDHDRPIRAAQVSLGTTIGAQIALALENARLLDEAQAAAEALRAKNAELDSFVYTVSHDLRSPLVTIQGMAGLLAAEHAARLDDEGRRYVERIGLNAGRMERLLLDLLALAQVGRDARTPEAIDLAGVVDEIAAELAEPMRARGVVLAVGPLPTVWAVRVHMELVVRNLLTNALKYMGEQPAPTIEIGAGPRDGLVECWVRDNGIGIDAAYHDTIFELFQRLKDVDAEGTGVGLPIARKIIEAAGGRIRVDSARGRGATFRFTCPLPPPDAV
jgi:signal transduction histidine kinase